MKYYYSKKIILKVYFVLIFTELNTDYPWQWKNTKYK